MNKEELNKKLAEWAGYKYHDYQVHESEYKDTRIEDPCWENPKGQRCLAPPNFLQSFDACFKWLVPKSGMDILWIVNNLNSPNPKIEYVFGFCRGCDNDLICWSKDLPVESCLSPIVETPSLAICLTIEKLIDSGR